MAEKTAISWCHHTHNLWWGCEKVSPACDHCFAERDAKRYGYDVWGVDSPRRFFKQEHYDAPLGWNAKAERVGERRRVFCGSFMDICERHPNDTFNGLMNAARADLFTRIIPQTPWLDWLLLTKRPANYVSILPRDWLSEGCPSHVWLGTTAENQEWLERRVRYLLRVAARVHFISYEPALGPLHLYEGVNWLIAGGESGHGHRDAELDWYRAVRDECRAAGVPFWFKQHSALHPKLLGDRLDGVQWHQVPEVA